MYGKNNGAVIPAPKPKIICDIKKLYTKFQLNSRLLQLAIAGKNVKQK